MTRTILVVALVLLPIAAQGQDSKSAPLVGELVALFDAMKIDSAAAASPEGFIGSIYVPGSQLLVVRGRFESPVRATVLLERRMYRDIYTDLNGASDPATKVFIYDLGADGLRFRRANNSQPFDTADIGNRSYQFDGNWGRQRLSREEYTRIYQSTDEDYARMVQALIDQLKKPS